MKGQRWCLSLLFFSGLHIDTVNKGYKTFMAPYLMNIRKKNFIKIDLFYFISLMNKLIHNKFGFAVDTFVTS